jgi:hypothetical protein
VLPPSTMKNAALAAIVIGIVGLSGCKKDDAKKNLPPPAPEPVAKGEPPPGEPPKTDPPKVDPPKVDPPAADPAPFTSADGGYSIAFPSPPTEQTQSQPTAIGTLDIHIAALDLGNQALLVSWQEQPAKAPKDPKKILDGQRDGMMSSFPGAKIMEQKDITLGTNPGRSFIIKMVTPDATQFTRVYVVGNRMYQIAAIGAGAGDAAAATKFLDSFALTKK